MDNFCTYNPQSAWAAEYKKQGIPSSFRKSPTRVVTEFISWLRKADHKGKTAADLGCGLGRNSFYLASQGYSVTALDLVHENTDFVNHEAKSMNLPIQAFAQDVSEKWPISPSSLDIAIDIFCYKHITSKQAQKKYRSELWKTLKPSGYYFISLASVNDGFYGPLLANSPSPAEKLIVDPFAYVSSYLYSIDDLADEFADLFTLVEAEEQTSFSPMHGNEYERKVLNFILQKRESAEKMSFP